MSHGLTKRQREVLAFLQRQMSSTGIVPTSREIQQHFGFASQTAAMDHLRALERKGVIRRLPGKARAVMLAEPPTRRSETSGRHGRMREVPLYGAIAAGMPVDAEVDPDERLGIDAELFGLPPDSDTFALKVRGDSMIDAHIVDGDIVLLSPRTPRNGDIVAALIDGETTLKRYLQRGATPYLKAENPDYPELIPAAELVIQGVLVALLRAKANVRGQ